VLGIRVIEAPLKPRQNSAQKRLGVVCEETAELAKVAALGVVNGATAPTISCALLRDAR
jgi:hypothetical protein